MAKRNFGNGVLVLTLLMIFLITAVGKAYPDPYQRMKEVSMQTSGSCADAGYRNGCCEGGANNCYVFYDEGICYCHEDCHRTNECCADILTIRCYATKCSTAGLDQGCCRGNNCRTSGGCYCDELCHINIDCCDDVPRGQQRRMCPTLISQLLMQERQWSRYQDLDFQERVRDEELMRARFIASLMRGRDGGRRNSQN